MKERVLILTDGKAGHENQSKAFAVALDRDFDLVSVSFRSKLAKTLSYLLDHLGLRLPQLLSFERGISDLKAASYCAVIGTGSGTFYAVKVLSRLLSVPCGVVLFPRGYSLGSFNCILAPAFDNPPARRNIVKVPANLVAVDPQRQKAAITDFESRYLGEKENPVAVIIGGPNKCSTMSVSWMKRELDELFTDTAGRPHWVTTSRRTPPAVEALVETYPWDYALFYSKDHYNPIPAFVALAKTLYVTAESTGMLSEACTSGAAEVRVLDNLNPGWHKFRRFVEGLIAGGYINGARKIDLSAAVEAARRLMGI